MTHPNVLVFGTGGIGSIYASLLAPAYASVTCVCRSNYHAVKNNGITINGPGNNISVRPSHVVSSVADAAAHRPYDFILVASKAFPGANPDTPSLIASVITPERTVIVLLQNGIGIEDEYRTAFPNNPLLSGVVYLPANQTAPGVVSMGNFNRLEIGTYPAEPADGDSAAAGMLRILRDVVRPAGVDVQLYDDVQPRRWSKLLVNASWNPICALTLCSDVDYMASSVAALPFVRSVMSEVVSIAQALGHAEVDEKEADRQIGRAQARVGTKGVEPSMLSDVKAGKPMEVEAILGNTVRIAEEIGVATPGLMALYALAKGLGEGLRQKQVEERDVVY
ncbi:2-dehydropantoate 2-reductase [Saccharata proteae CBS 121410]|uniref:2-dehydropantoate 2-reductase n=1 Tax=Saccharata proteae CBS 121410 TaxID=1314787 RepID=A0A9P4I1H9_9PEZI|nr:2-dehydropantoate 2-reductase [Saccharata proteae CBS 121410]